MQFVKSLSNDKYFMAMALLSAKRSPDPNTQVGACLVDSNNRIIGNGYNDFPKGFDEFPWDKTTTNPLENKHTFVVHAETNAILDAINTGRNSKGSRIFVTLFPCNKCALIILKYGIREIIYLSDKRASRPDTIESKEILKNQNVTYRKFEEENLENLYID